jgi:hypothetical protein
MLVSVDADVVSFISSLESDRSANYIRGYAEDGMYRATDLQGETGSLAPHFGHQSTGFLLLFYQDLFMF